MPVNTLPFRCPVLCATCQHRAAGDDCCGGDTPCCNCFASAIEVEHIPLTADPPPADPPPQYFTSPIWNIVSNKWTGNVFDDSAMVSPVGTIEIYFERIDGDCYLTLVSDVLGFGTGSEQRWALDEETETCRTLHFTTTLGDGSTLVVNGAIVRAYPVPPCIEDCCSVQCCEPGACMTFTVTGDIYSAVTDDFGDAILDGDFEVAVSLDNGLSHTTIAGVTASCAANGYAVTPYMASAGNVTGTEVLVAAYTTTHHLVVGIYFQDSLYVKNSIIQVYSFTPHIPGTACETTALTLVSSAPTGGGGSVFVGSFMSVDTIAEMVPDTDCLPAVSACAKYPRCLTFRMDGVTDDECSECDDFNFPVNTLYRSPGTCVWYSTKITSGHCLSSISTATYLQWVLIFDDDDDSWTLSLVAYDSGDAMLGVLVAYVLTGDSSTVFSKVLTLDSYSDACATWQGTISLNPCNSGNLLYGACCEPKNDMMEVVSVCEDMLASDCEQLNGTFLGAGTRCQLEGCLGCSTDCSTFCDAYTFRFAISGATFNTCWGGAIDETVTFTRNGTNGCQWDAFVSTMIGDWTFTMTIDDSTSPQTLTITGSLFGGQAANFTATATGYCNYIGYTFTLDSWSSDPDCDPVDADKFLQVTAPTDCPGFLQ